MSWRRSYRVQGESFVTDNRAGAGRDIDTQLATRAPSWQGRTRRVHGLASDVEPEIEGGTGDHGHVLTLIGRGV